VYSRTTTPLIARGELVCSRTTEFTPRYQRSCCSGTHVFTTSY
jgi:hypothetical protein